MLIVFQIIIVGMLFFVSVAVFFLHSLYKLFLLHLISQHIHQVDCFSVWVSGALQCIGYPGIRLTAYINKQVTGGYLQNIFHGRLETMHVCSVTQKQGKIHILSLVTQDFLYPVVFWKNSGYNLKLLTICAGILLFAAISPALAFRHTGIVSSCRRTCTAACQKAGRTYCGS